MKSIQDLIVETMKDLSEKRKGVVVKTIRQQQAHNPERNFERHEMKTLGRRLWIKRKKAERRAEKEMDRLDRQAVLPLAQLEG